MHRFEYVRSRVTTVLLFVFILAGFSLATTEYTWTDVQYCNNNPRICNITECNGITSCSAIVDGTGASAYAYPPGGSIRVEWNLTALDDWWGFSRVKVGQTGETNPTSQDWMGKGYASFSAYNFTSGGYQGYKSYK